MKRTTTGALALATIAAGWAALRPRMLRWGTVGDEAVRPLSGDDLLPSAPYVTTRAITIAAPPDVVFPWIVQLGQNRGGFYTYDALENLFKLDIHSADRIHPSGRTCRPGSTT